MQHLSIDIETYSSVNLQKAGVYKYAESPDFDILLFGYSVNGRSSSCHRLCLWREDSCGDCGCVVG